VWNVPNATYSGPLSTIVFNWTDPNQAFVAAVNGGVWKTNGFRNSPLLGNETNSYSPTASNDTEAIQRVLSFYKESPESFGPSWQTNTDFLPCISIAALAICDTNASIIVAGCGYGSNLERFNPDWAGVFISLDGGETWNITTFPRGLSISAIVVYNTNIIVTANYRENPRPLLVPRGGLFVSKDLGASWDDKFGTFYSFYSVVRDARAGFLYALGAHNPNQSVIAYSTDDGFSWSDLYGDALSLVARCPSIGNVIRNGKLAVHFNHSDTVYATLFNDVPGGKHCYDFFVSFDNAKTFHALGQPLILVSTPVIGNGTDGTDEEPGKFQTLGATGIRHLTLLADPYEYGTIYVGGSDNYRGSSFKIRKQTLFSRIFRAKIVRSQIGNITEDVSVTWDPLTLNGTAHFTAPSQDTRGMAWDFTTGYLFLTTDHGLFYRTSPRDSNGDWFAYNGDLVISQVHSAVADAPSRRIAVACHDTGIQQSVSSRGPLYVTETGGNGYALVSDPTTAHFFGTTNNPTHLWGGAFGSDLLVNITLNFTLGNDFPISVPQIIRLDYTSGLQNWVNQPNYLQINAVNPKRLLLCGQATPSLLGGCIAITPPSDLTLTSTLTFNLSRIIPFTAFQFQYGGFLFNNSDENLFFGITSEFFYRQTSNFTDQKPITAPWQAIRQWGDALAINPLNYNHVVVVDQSSTIWWSSNFGNNWTDITGNLFNATDNLFSANCYSVGIVPLEGGNVSAILAGTSKGVFLTFSDQPAPHTWIQFGQGVPNCLLLEIKYDITFDYLILSSFGRGAFVLPLVMDLLKFYHDGICPTFMIHF